MLHFTSNAICVMSARNERSTSRTTCETKGEKRQASRNNYWKDPEKHRASSRASSHACYWKDPETKRVSSHACYWKDPETKGRPPIPVIGRTLRPKGHLPGHPPIPVIGRTLRPKGHLPGHPPIPVILGGH